MFSDSAFSLPLRDKPLQTFYLVCSISSFLSNSFLFLQLSCFFISSSTQTLLHVQVFPDGWHYNDMDLNQKLHCNCTLYSEQILRHRNLQHNNFQSTFKKYKKTSKIDFKCFIALHIYLNQDFWKSPFSSQSPYGFLGHLTTAILAIEYKISMARNFEYLPASNYNLTFLQLC